MNDQRPFGSVLSVFISGENLVFLRLGLANCQLLAAGLFVASRWFSDFGDSGDHGDSGDLQAHFSRPLWRRWQDFTSSKAQFFPVL
jgi:hypothetical protein